MSHFNKGVIWGRVKEFNERSTKDNKKPYLDLKITCASERFGDVLVYARMWGGEKTRAFLDAYKDGPGELYKFTGILSLLEREGVQLIGYQIFDFRLVTEPVHQRAVFILRGEVVGRSRIGDDSERPHILLNYKQARENYAQDFTFRIYCHKDIPALVMKGETLDVKGAMQDKDAFWGGSGACVPFAEEVASKGKAL